MFFNSRYKHYVKTDKKNFSTLFVRLSLGNKKLGVFKQEDFLLSSNKETAKFVYQLLNNKVLEPQRYKNLFIKLKGFETQGIYLNHFFKFFNMNLALANDFYMVTFMQDGVVKGYGEILSENKYDYYAHADYYYTKNFLYKRRVKYTNGYGYNFHIGMKYKIRHFKVLFIINNLFSYVFIKKVPYSNVYLNSNNSHYNNGYISYSPMFYGWEYYKNYYGAFDKKYNLIVENDKFYLEFLKWKDLFLKYFGIKKNNYIFSYEFRNKSLNIKLSKEKYDLNFEIDNLNFKRSKVLQLNFAYKF